MKITTYKDIYYNGFMFSVGINYDTKEHISNLIGESSLSGDELHVLSLSPSMANELINELINQLKWYRSPLYQWCRNKTNIKKQMEFKR